MAGSSFFALLDDIAALLDDISLMSKVAAKKSASVLSDDLAVNAEQVTGMKADRELPVVWAVFKGSLKNKAILVPCALILSAVLPAAVKWLLMAGGIYLCYEGFEAIKDKFSRNKDGERSTEKKAAPKTPEALAAYEKRKIKGAIKTDFILSAEIIVITLNVVAEAPLYQQIITLALIAVLMTVGVYGLVAGIVRLDDAGFALAKTQAQGMWGRITRSFGKGLVAAAPILMKALSWIGTLAMFLVGGTFVAEGIAPLEHAVEALVADTAGWGPVVKLGLFGVIGAVAGFVTALLVGGFGWVRGRLGSAE
ncbi:DUF808 domain-containing protein [Pseudomonas cremoricolorata]|uniref:DUF808 domain-containing protein n=1 Tax=Pseudomonas cremoricolorata TaxID=157783 RepID=UPI000418EAB0|nr:DUF808 domain-containing protein [Pseudomonas cremoricolorata]